MVKKYKTLIVQKQDEIVATKAKFICGLEKLELANSQVSIGILFNSSQVMWSYTNYITQFLIFSETP